MPAHRSRVTLATDHRLSRWLGLPLRLTLSGQLRGGLPAALAGAWYKKSEKPKTLEVIAFDFPDRCHRLRISFSLINYDDGPTQLTIT